MIGDAYETDFVNYRCTECDVYMKTKNIILGILAHVDAGKTTLSESILFETGLIDRIGRVDHKDAYLDTFDLEKARGITIFSKQAVFPLDDYKVTLLDTPGHVDFSAEMERTLRVLDYAILVISGTDGVQGHTTTVWKLLKRYNVPTFIFVNKMDLVGADRVKLLMELQTKVHENCTDFEQESEEAFNEALAVCDEQLMEHYLEFANIHDEDIQLAISRRHVFPVYFGSALKNEGVENLIMGLNQYMKAKSYPDIFGARVFKVSRNQQGERLTHIKMTGGYLKVKDLLTNQRQRNVELDESDHQAVWQEKVDQIRIYSGVSFETEKEVGPGTICTLTGLSRTKPGDGLGFENQGEAPALVPVLSYKVVFPEGTHSFTMLKNLRLLEEEEPHLNVIWNERLAEVHVQVMGEIQIEILRSTIFQRFDVVVDFDKGSLVYRETIKEPVLGMGHFEPLKHYAEVHLLLEPLPMGDGMIYEADCSEDILDRNWQRLVVSHLNERQHKGVLTGSALTDMKITLVTGRGHNKHTEGGDFREATFRALRQGLMKGLSVLLEPVYDYHLEVPKSMLGKAMSDIERMYGRYNDPEIEGEIALIKGVAPASTMMHYGSEVIAYTKGLGKLSLSLRGYEPCHNQETVVDEIGYRPENDVDNPSGSVFCSKGTGYGVTWEEAEKHMHLDSGIRLGIKKETTSSVGRGPRLRSSSVTDQELESIFVKTYGESKERRQGSGSQIFDTRPKKPTTSSSQNHQQAPKQAEKERYLLVDGYNILFAWEELKNLAEESLDAARARLMDILSDYQGQTGETVILVFDAYKVTGHRETITAYHNITVVYTKEAETADQYIERSVYSIRPSYEVTVATSDVVEQIIILGKGARKMSADGLMEEIDSIRKGYKEHFEGKSVDKKHRPFEKFLGDVSIDE